MQLRYKSFGTSFRSPPSPRQPTRTFSASSGIVKMWGRVSASGTPGVYARSRAGATVDTVSYTSLSGREGLNATSAFTTSWYTIRT